MRAISLSLLLVLLSIPPAAFAGWEDTLKAQFDIVETFDTLQDWTGTGSLGEWADVAHLPKKADGSPSDWNYYSYGRSTALGARGTWIGDNGMDGNGVPNQLGTKAASIDLGNLTGPSRLGMYIGDGTQNSGYTEMYTFYRVKIPRQEWPTAGTTWPNNCLAENIGSYTDGQPYGYITSWKFFNVGTGYLSYNDWHETSAHPVAGPYGDGEFLQHIKLNEGYPAFTVESQTPLFTPSKGQAAGIHPNLVDQWIGVETRWKLETVPGSAAEGGSMDGIVEIWVYDENGNVTNGGAPVLSANNVRYRLSGNTDHYLNRFAFGGNNSQCWQWGNGMISTYHVDDLVIDNARIGPTYFSLLNGQPVATPPTTTTSKAPGRYAATQQLTLTATAGVTKYCFGAGCTPTATYSAPFKVPPVNTAGGPQWALRYQSTDGAGVETVKESVFLKQRRR